MAEPTKQAKPFTVVVGVISGAVGWGFSHYVGSAGWIPGIATVLLFLLFAKTPLRPKFFAGAICVTGGHVVWFVSAAILTDLWSQVILDIAVLLAGLVWLWIRPGLVSAIALGIVQTFSLVVNLTAFSSASVGSAEHRALTVHCVWRLLAIICLIVGYRNLRRLQPGTPALPAQPL